MKTEYISLEDFCKEIGISFETGRNWLKLGKIITQKDNSFTRAYLAKIRKEISSEKNSMLKNRRNKKYVSGNKIYNSYILQTSRNQEQVKKLINKLEQDNIRLTDSMIESIIIGVAKKLVKQRDYLTSNSSVVEDVFGHNKKEYQVDIDFYYEDDEDLLGLIYQSCKNLKSRKANGAYYTPTRIVKKLVDIVFEDNCIDKTKTICDPCCGTANFLLQLPKEVLFEQVYGNDIDVIAVKIARINLAMKYCITDAKLLEKHITNKNFFTRKTDKHDIFIGNPPWGSVFSEDEKIYLKENYKSAKKRFVEAYDIALEKAIQNTPIGGKVAFVLPEAILNVKSHKLIREVILEEASILEVDYIGNAFDKVQCPCILLEIVHKPKGFSTVGLKIKSDEKSFVIKTDRNVNSDCFGFYSDDEEYTLIDSITNSDKVRFLKNNAVFGLGIVSGQNNKIIGKVKSSKNEVILKGTDLEKYIYNESDNYCEWNIDNFQQYAPEKLYRAKEKLLYKFINDNLVFAYDDKQHITLNSCNFVIPSLEDMDMKYIMAVLNSSTAQFIFKKQFNSVKVLRSHIEKIPIPIATKKEQDYIVSRVNQILCRKEVEKNKNEINNYIEELYKKISS